MCVMLLFIKEVVSIVLSIIVSIIYSTFRNWCAHLHSTIDSPTLMPSHTYLDWEFFRSTPVSWMCIVSYLEYIVS
jgi:hypothetical protein